MKKKYFLKNKKRFVCFIAFVLVSIFTIISMTNTYGYKNDSYEIIKVNSGDTLWEIAIQYNERGDIREYIHRLMEINNLDNSEIREGTELKVIIE
ncbi:LysM peptidoglycan-binding domain-containing protein [Herbivorax sp. ANBcel31]|uniref:cell division suppressor protein YneA n=1 Tax=Herbivorax sp. ANBcel31 TaxID=3069754 RepID=UPI0027B5A1C6|nr:LysM peptidoglycan-binding domain-containing protein [Herbivorax sp. ANBcel31]MDQ2087012.1 LysM peptidoglycan-binding domain-containing protein [Herbivorax sp. ANBcel31]